MQDLERAIALKSELDQLRPLDEEQEARIMQKFRLDWNYHSNHLEGNSLTYGETKALILHGITAQGKPLKDHFEITGHNEAINWVLDVVKGDYPLNENFIRQLHQLVLKESYERDAITPDGQPTKKRVEVGKYKSTPNHVKTATGEIFRFATPEETPALMHELVEWYREKRKNPDTNSILLAAEFHYKFIRIHPFDDGNGRVARILMNFILLQFGYPPVIIRTDDKNNYLNALRQADGGMIEPFIQYIAKNLVRSLELMIAGARGEEIEEPDDVDKEITLLKMKLADGHKIIYSKSNFEGILADSIAPMINAVLSKLQKFDELFNENLLTVTLGSADNQRTITIPEELALENAIFHLVGDSTKNFTVGFTYLNFLKSRGASFNVYVGCNITLGKYDFEVKPLPDSEKVFKIVYDKKEDKEAFQKIANALAKSMLRQIDKKLTT